MRRFPGGFGALMAYFMSILLCGSLSSGHAADLGLWDNGLGPYNQSPSTYSFRCSRARIIQDDAACLQDLDFDLLNDKTADSEAIVEEAHETLSHLPDVSDREPEPTTSDGRLQLALSPDEHSSEIFKATPSNS